MNQDPFSVVALLERNGLVLAISRRNDHENLGLPGGKIEPGESPEEALVRELGEECGILAEEYEMVYEHLDRVEGDLRRPCRGYRVTSWAGSPHSVEGQRVVWVPPGRLLEPSCSFRDYNERLFDHIGTRVKK